MWFLFALSFAFFTSIGILFNKKLTKIHPPLIVLYVGLVLQVLFLGITLITLNDIPKVTPEFYVQIIIAGCIDALAFAAAIKAIKLSQISLITPLAAFNPVFTAVFASILLKEIPTEMKLLGIVIIVIGAYALNFDKADKGLLRPFKVLITHKGAQLFFLANLLWAITPIFQKNAILMTDPHSPLFASFVGYSISVFLLTFFVLKPLIRYIPTLKPSLKIFLILGVLNTLSGLAGFSAFVEGNVAYVTAIFKLSSLFTIAWGGIFLRETHIKEKLVGASIMIVGTILLVV